VDFETVLLDAGWVTGQVELESDILLSDNVRYFTFYTPPKITVIHLTPPESAHTLLPLVLKPALESGYFEYQQVNPEAFLSLAPQPNTVVVVENINTFPPVLLETLRRFLIWGVSRGYGETPKTTLNSNGYKRCDLHMHCSKACLKRTPRA